MTWAFTPVEIVSPRLTLGVAVSPLVPAPAHLLATSKQTFDPTFDSLRRQAHPRSTARIPTKIIIGGSRV
jgi:hypothetical protein